MKTRHQAAAILGLAMMMLSPVSARASEPEGYRVLGDLAVMDRGRVKPLQTLAVERVKLIYSRQAIKFKDEKGKVIEKWGPMAAYLDWSARPEYWNAKEFILIEYLPLKSLILSGRVRDQLSLAASRPTVNASDKAALESLSKSESYTAKELAEALKLSSINQEDKAAIKTLARKLEGEHKWLAPEDLENAEFEVNGQTTTLLDWFGTILRKRDGSRGMGGGSSALSPLEQRASEVAERLVHYQAIRDGNPRESPSLDLDVLPRPNSPLYLDFTAQAYQKWIDSQGTEVTGLESDAAMVLDTYLQDLQGKDRMLPGAISEDLAKRLESESSEVQAEVRQRQQEFNGRFGEWLRKKAEWVPLRLLLDSEPEELNRAGFPLEKVEAMRAAYGGLQTAEQEKPGQLDKSKAQMLVAAARGIGEEFGGYPPASSMARESHFNRFGPFYWAPAAFGLAALLLLLSLGIDAKPGSWIGTLARGTYGVGLAAFLAGIGLEVYGFYLRVMISGWAPVTNMYETVIWVALVTSVIGLVLELVSRKIYPALAASLVAMLTTVLAANVSLLDPTIGSLMPVLRSNYWLTIHVLTIVSSYAAFALALGLGLLAVGFYLTASYRRSASYAELLAPLFPGLPLFLFGAAGLYGSYTGAPTSFLASQLAFYPLGVLTAIGGAMCIAAVFAAVGELSNRSPGRAAVLGGGVALAGVAGLVIPALSAGPSWLRLLPVQYLQWILLILGGSWVVLSLFGSMAKRYLAEARETVRMKAADAGAGLAAEQGQWAEAGSSVIAGSAGGGGVATLERPATARDIRERQAGFLPPADDRVLAMRATASRIKPLAGFIYRAMQVGVLLCAAGTILGGVWADYSWGRFWGWDPKEVWALITLLVYLVPLHGRFAGWVNTFGLVAASVVCFLSVLMAWYGVNFVLGVGLHSYGFVEGGGQGIVLACCVAVLAVVGGAGWRRGLSSRDSLLP